MLYVILAIREILMIDRFNVAEMFLKPIPRYTMLIVLVIWSIVFCWIVTKRTVKRSAFDYAKTLLETIDAMDFDFEA